MGQVLNTCRRASLYETFPVAEARQITQRLEFHLTPRHGSSLIIASPGLGRGGDRVQHLVAFNQFDDTTSERE